MVLFGGLGRVDNNNSDIGEGYDDEEEEEEGEETMPLNDLWVMSPMTTVVAGGGGGGDNEDGGGGFSRVCGVWSLVMLDGVGPSPRSLAAIVSGSSSGGGDGGGVNSADLFLFGGYGFVELPRNSNSNNTNGSSGSSSMMADGHEEEEDEEEGGDIIMAYIDDLWRLSWGVGGVNSNGSGSGIDGTLTAPAVAASGGSTPAAEWTDEAGMGFPGESIVEGRNGHSLTWCGDKLVLFGGFVGDGFDAGVHVARPPSSSSALD